LKLSWLLLPVVLVYGLLLAAIALLLDLLLLIWLLPARLLYRRVDEAPPAKNASVVVLNWNGRHFLQDLLPTLQVAVGNAPGDHEVIVVDNGSDDGSADFVAREHPWAKVVRLPENRFFIRGNAAGARAATRDLLVFLNNDMRVEPHFLRELLAPFGAPDLFATTARIEMEGARVETGCTSARWSKGGFELAHVDLRAPSVALWPGGGSSAFDRRKYEALGGFESLYEPCYVEDVSLGYQAWRRGWRVQFVPGAVVHHVRRGTSEKVFGPQQVDLLDRRNRELFFWRSVTGPLLVLEHALLLPRLVLKHGRRTGIGLQLRALAATLPRLPQAFWQRERSRLHYRCSDRDVLRVANP
jgi:GT2 family glycosyltransferase